MFEQGRHAVMVSVTREHAIIRAQAKGEVAEGIDPRRAASFLVSTIEGALSLARNTQSLTPLENCHAELSVYLDAIRAQ